MNATNNPITMNKMNRKNKKALSLLRGVLWIVGVLAALSIPAAFTACTATLQDDGITGAGENNSNSAPGALHFILPQRPAFEEGGTTRAVGGFQPAGEWAEGDKVLVHLELKLDKGDDYSGNDKYSTYHIFATLAHGSTDDGSGKATWTLPVPDDVIIHHAMSADGNTFTDPAFYPNSQLPLLETATDGSLSLRIPQEAFVANGSGSTLSAQLIYAPSLQWPTLGNDGHPIDANNTIIKDTDSNPITTASEFFDALLVNPKPGTLSGITERWGTGYKTVNNSDLLTGAITFDFTAAGAFTSPGGRLRVYTGREGDVVQLFCPLFLPTVGDKNEVDNIYTATTDKNGNAYFYGVTGTSITDITELDGDNDKTFVVSTSNTTTDGTPTPIILSQIFAANANAKVKMTASGSKPTAHAIDASIPIEVNIPEKIVLNADNYDTADALKNALTDAYSNNGKTIWEVTNLAANGKMTVDDKRIAIRNALVALNGDESAAITLYLPDITELPMDAFNGCYKLTTASMPAVTTLGYTALASTGLTTVSLPKVITIGGQAFSNCRQLTSITEANLPKVKTLGMQVFDNCPNLTSINLPSVTTLEWSAFEGCDWLTDDILNLPNVTTVGDNAFAKCTGLTTITLPSVTKLGQEVFTGCTKLTNITLPGLKIVEKGTFVGYTGPTISLPKATDIKERAFLGCTGLTSVLLPEAKNLGFQVFVGCAKLTTITLPKADNFYGYEIFKDCTALTAIKCGVPIMRMSWNAFKDAATKNITLYLSSKQKILEKDAADEIYIPSYNYFDNWGPDGVFSLKRKGEVDAAYTFQEIKKYTE